MHILSFLGKSALRAVFVLAGVCAAAAFQLAVQAQPQTLTKSPLSPYSSMPRIEAARAILGDGWTLTAPEAAKLESELERDPENLAARIRLLSYYTQYTIFPELRSKHLFWLIEHHPDSDVFQLNTVATGVLPDYSNWKSPNIESAQALWLQQTERYPANPKVLANAATAFGQRAAPIALELVRRTRAAEPDNPEWVDWLAAIYATAVRSGFAGGRQLSRASSGKTSFHTGFWLPLTQSELLKGELETSSDAALVGSTAEELLRETALLQNDPFSIGSEIQASEAFGKQLLLRAQELDPNNPRWKTVKP